MVRNDNFFLEKWISYYGKELGNNNLFVFLMEMIFLYQNLSRKMLMLKFAQGLLEAD
jgi:hypothetical protein